MKHERTYNDLLNTLDCLTAQIRDRGTMISRTDITVATYDDVAQARTTISALDRAYEELRKIKVYYRKSGEITNA